MTLLGAFDHVVVGEDVAFVVDHEARAGGGAAARFGFDFAEGVEAFGFLRFDLRFDEGDAFAVGLVDLVDDVGAAVFGLGVDRRRQRRGDGRRRAAVRLDRACGDRDPADDGDDQAPKESGAEGTAKFFVELVHGAGDWRREVTFP